LTWGDLIGRFIEFNQYSNSGLILKNLDIKNFGGLCVFNSMVGMINELTNESPTC
jgi:hypothetical protein